MDTRLLGRIELYTEVKSTNKSSHILTEEDKVFTNVEFVDLKQSCS